MKYDKVKMYNEIIHVPVPPQEPSLSIALPQ
jgi:hypothetical protein